MSVTDNGPSGRHGENAISTRGGTRGLTLIAVTLVAALVMLPVQWFVLLSTCRDRITAGLGLSFEDAHATPLHVACEMRTTSLAGRQVPSLETITVTLLPNLAGALGLVVALAITLALRRQRRRVRTS